MSRRVDTESRARRERRERSSKETAAFVGSSRLPSTCRPSVLRRRSSNSNLRGSVRPSVVRAVLPRATVVECSACLAPVFAGSRLPLVRRRRPSASPPLLAPLADPVAARARRPCPRHPRSCLCCCCGGGASPPSPPPPLSVRPLAPPLAGFFSKTVPTACGVAVLAHACVSDAALLQAARRVDAALASAPRAAARLAALGCTVQVVGAAQRCSDLPQYGHLASDPAARDAFDARGRGYGGLHPSCAEENLLSLPSDRYRDHRDILTHELAHTVQDWGHAPAASEALHAAAEAARAAAVASGRWPGAYAASNDSEYFAECAMWHFGSRGDFGAVKGARKGRRWLARYDPAGAALVEAAFSDAYADAGGGGGGGADGGGGGVAVVALAPGPAPPSGASPSPAACSLVVANDSAAAVALWWVDCAGVPHPYAVVGPGCAHGQATFQGHAWQCAEVAAAAAGEGGAGGEGGRVLGGFVAPVGHDACRVTIPP